MEQRFLKEINLLKDQLHDAEEKVLTSLDENFRLEETLIALEERYANESRKMNEKFRENDQQIAVGMYVHIHMYLCILVLVFKNTKFPKKNFPKNQKCIF